MYGGSSHHIGGSEGVKEETWRLKSPPCTSIPGISVLLVDNNLLILKKIHVEWQHEPYHHRLFQPVFQFVKSIV